MTEPTVEAVVEIVSALAQRPEPIQPDSKILDEGYIDSLNMFHILAEIESRFSVQIGAMDVSIADFESPLTIFDLIRRVASST